MKNPLLLLATLLCSALIAFGQSSSTAPSAAPSAQSPSQSSSPSASQDPSRPATPNAADPSAQAANPSSSAASAAGSMTIDGCLGGSAGNYTVKDKTSGTTYNLTGISSNLDQHVGSEVQVTGTPGEGQGSIHASAMKKVAPNCTAGK